MVRAIEKLLVRFYWACLRRPIAVFAAVLLLAAVAAGGLPRLRNATSARDLFEDGTPSALRYDDVARQFTVGNPILLLIAPRAGAWDPALLCAIHDWLTDEALTNPEIERVSSAFDLRRPVSSPGSFVYRRYLDPCHADPADIPGTLAELRHSPLAGGLLTSDGRDFGVEVSFRDTPGGSRGGRFDPAPIARFREDFERKFGGNFSSVWTGPAMYDHYVARGMRRFPLLNAASLLFFFLMYGLYSRSWKSGAILLATLLFTGAVIFGGMGLAGHSIDVLTSTVFTLVIIAAHQDFSFITSAQMARPENFRRTFRRFLVPSFFTSATTMIGFFSLCVSDLTVIRRFGFWAGFGAGLEWFMILIVLPSALAFLPRLRRWTGAARELHAARFERFARWTRLSRGTAIAILGLMLLTPWAVATVQVKDDPTALFPVGHPFRTALAYLRETRGWENSVDLMLEFRDFSPERDRVIAEIAKLPLVAKIETGKEILEFMKRGTDAGGAAIVDTDAVTALRKRYRASDGRERAVVYLKSSDLSRYREFRDSLERVCGRGVCEVSGLLDLYVEYSYAVSRTLAESLVVSLVLVTLLLTVILVERRTPHGFALVATSFWGPLVMLILLAALKIPLNLYTCNCASVLIGLTGDNAIQFIFAARKGRLAEGLHARRSGAIFTSLTMAASSLILLGAAFRPPQLMGGLLSLGFVLCLVGDYWLLKGLLQPRVR